MPDRLFIQLPADGPDVAWLRQGTAPGEITSRTGPLPSLSGESANCQVIVFAPGSDVVLLAANVPPMNRQRMSMAVPFALEDQLAGDPDSLHFAFGKQAGDGSVPVAVVDHARMDAWLARLDEAGVRPDRLIPEILALPSLPDTWTILLDTDTALVRTGPLSGFAVDRPNLAAVAQDALAEAGKDAPRRIRLLPCVREPDAGAGRVSLPIPPDRSVDCQVMEAPFEPNKLALLSRHFQEQHAIDLLQGKYARTAGIGQRWRLWRAPMALAAVWLVAWIGGLLLDISDLSTQNRQLTDEMETVYRAVFPNARAMNNPRVRMGRALDELRKNKPGEAAGFLGLLGRAGPHLQSSQNARLTHLSFHSGELELRVEMDDLQAFDGLKERLIREAGLAVEVLSATARGNTVTGHLKIGER